MIFRNGWWIFEQDIGVGCIEHDGVILLFIDNACCDNHHKDLTYFQQLPRIGFVGSIFYYDSIIINNFLFIFKL